MLLNPGPDRIELALVCVRPGICVSVPTTEASGLHGAHQEGAKAELEPFAELKRLEQDPLCAPDRWREGLEDG